MEEVVKWGLKPAFVTADSWYSCVDNLKKVKNHSTGLMVAVESNRLVSTEKGVCNQVQILKIPEARLMVWLRNCGEVKLFWTKLKDQLRHYIVFLPNCTAYPAFEQSSFQKLHDQRYD